MLWASQSASIIVHTASITVLGLLNKKKKKKKKKKKRKKKKKKN